MQDANKRQAKMEGNLANVVDQEKQNRRLARIAGIIAVIALLLGGWGIYSTVNLANFTEEVKKTCLANAKPGPKGAAGASAYSLWLSVGNTGSLQDFLDSLIGEKGPNGYRGSTGFNGADGQDGATGPSGTDGASAYQLWLDAGNTGTPDEFLASLIGDPGQDGTDGADGLDGTNGINGTDGVDGAAGLSAYELWVAQGNSGTEDDFLASLVGQPGSNGTNGTNGKSAYQIWLDAGNTGTEADFLASLKGDPGTCTPGSGLGYFGSFYDTTTQVNTAAINLMTFNNSDVHSDGVSISNGSRIVLAHPGTYNIQFSAQVTRLTGGHSADIFIWLKQNGVDYPDSNTGITLQANGQRVVAAWNFFVTTTNENEYVELAWQSDEPSMELLAVPHNSMPGIPSVILTVNQVN